MKNTAQKTIHNIRELLNVSDAKISKLLGVTPGAISLWSKGYREPTGLLLRMMVLISKRIENCKISKQKVSEIVGFLYIGNSLDGLEIFLEEIFYSSK